MVTADGAVVVGVGEGTVVLPAGIVLMDGNGGKEKSGEESESTADEGTGKVDSEGADIRLPDNDSQLKHIFRKADGHLPDTPENRTLLIEVANDSGNYLGTDKYGNEWYAALNSDGSQLWVQIRNGIIKNGGLNEIPKSFDSSSGFSSSVKPSQK